MEYSQEQLNYFRLCHVAFNLVPVGLRQIFKKEWDILYKTTSLGEWKDTPQNGHDFYNKESKASRKKNARYLATIQNGDTAEWDCTCLFFAILYSDSIGKTLSPAVRTNVDDIRQVRNEIAHIAEGKLTDADFQTSVDRVSNAFTSRGLPISEIQEVKNQTTFPTQEVAKLKKQARDLQVELDTTRSDLQETKSTLQSTEADLVSAKEENKALIQEITAKLQPFCFLPLTPPHEIIRRSHDIERIKDKMEKLYSGANGAVSAVYLSGNPGCGKSQLAREIGQQFFSERTDNTEDLVFVATLNAESVETLAESYLNLGRHLGITEYALTSLESLKREKPIEAIQRLHHLILPKVSKFTKWLIIADNVVDLRSVRGLLPPTGSKEWGHGQVLITTQDSSTIPQNAPHTYHESLSKGMRLDEAVKLLELSKLAQRREQVENVAKVLDCQPLALAAAAYYARAIVDSGSSSFDWEKYLHQISTYSEREAIEKFLAKKSTAYPKTTMAAVSIAIERAVESDEVLHQTFSFLKICAHDDLPLEAVSKFVKAKVNNQPEELIKTMIKESSLILVSSDDGNEQTYLRLHTIVHAALKGGQIFNLQSTESDHNMAEAVKIFQTLFEENRENYALFKKLTPHCKCLLEHMTSDFTTDESNILKTLTPFMKVAEVIEWLGTVARACNKTYDLSFAKNVVDLACSLLENIDDSDSGASIKGRIYNLSGLVYRNIGECSRAKALIEKALMIWKNNFGEDHAKVATGYNNLAAVYNSLGEYNQAKEFHEKALMIRKKKFGENHADVGASYNNVATVYYYLGENNQAKVLYEKALMIGKRIFGEDHANVASSYCNLASVYFDTGEYNKAKELHKKALTIRRKIFGEDHAQVASSYHHLALVYDRTGEYNQAKELLEKSLMIRQKNVGDEHAEVAECFKNLAGVYYSIGEYNQAKELNKKALTIQEKIFGEVHADVAASYHHLASVYDRIGEYSQAKELYEKALIIRKKIFGENHADVAASSHKLATVYFYTGEYNQAKELYQRAIMIRKTIFGEDHAEVALSYNNLASVYNRLGEFNQAKEFHEKALMIRKKIFGENHADVGASYNNVASVYYFLGEYNRAKVLYEKALMIGKRIFGEDHANVASSYCNLASVYYDIGEYNKAKEFHEKALVVRRKIFGEDHAKVASSYYHLASVYDRIGEYNQAKELRVKARRCCRRADTAASCHNLASMHKDIGEYNEKALNKKH